jgi:hypothetical protein
MKIKRRALGLLAGASLTALKVGRGNAQTAADPNLLKTTLTPFGSERAGNADGSIPAWTGGYTTLPAGWQPGQSMPDFFAGEQPVVVIDSSNMSQYADKLSDGVQALMTRDGYSIKVFPTHRPQAMPQVIYDNTVKNLTNARFIDQNFLQNGFTGAFGGIPFPIPNTSDPLLAGVQIMYNHLNRWNGYAQHWREYGVVVNGGVPVMTNSETSNVDYPYYYKQNLAETQSRISTTLDGPAVLVGEAAEFVSYNSSQLQDTWELLNGQGRVRKAPQLMYDTPVSFDDGASNYDEGFGFQGPLIEYDWKYIEKKELYIPYSNNGLLLLPYQQVLKPKFLDPEVVRWELHRVWVVEATLHSGSRNVLARRRFYVDEDSWTVATTDSWDANNNLFHVQYIINCVRPDMPGMDLANYAIYNLQTGQYVLVDGPWDQKAHPSIEMLQGMPDSDFDPQNMAASAQY